MPKLVFKKLKLVSKMQKLPRPAFLLQVLGWKSHKKMALEDLGQGDGDSGGKSRCKL